MIQIDFGSGRYVRLREFQRYSTKFDGPGVRLECWFEGKQYWIELPVEPGKSLREAREKAAEALQKAVKEGKYGEVKLEPICPVLEQKPKNPVPPQFLKARLRKVKAGQGVSDILPATQDTQ